MATGQNIHTYFGGTWHKGNPAIINAADHGAWLGSNVFDGARYFDGVAPDLLAHCQRVNRSAEAPYADPNCIGQRYGSHNLGRAKAICDRRSGLYTADVLGGRRRYVSNRATWQLNGLAICLEEIPLASSNASARLTRTRFRRPVLEDAVVNAKAACLYPNNARMLVEARSKGFDNALVADAMGNVAETATSNIFMVKDGEVFTPIANGTFLAGITRARHISNLSEAGLKVHEKVLSFRDFEEADEIFMSGNMNKVTPVSAFEDRQYQVGPIAQKARSLYWDWAATAGRP